jgi:transposase
VILDGGSRGDASQVGDVGLQTIRDWVLQFNAEGPAGLQTNLPPGRPPRLDAEHRPLARWVEDGPLPAVDGVVRWRLAI